MNLDWLQTLSWASAAAQPATGGQSDPKPFIFMIVTIGVLFYLLIAAPSRRDQRRRQAMLEGVAKGDSVVTTGGIMGTVESVDSAKGVVVINVAPKVNIPFAKSAVASITARKGKPHAEEADKKS